MTKSTTVLNTQGMSMAISRESKIIALKPCSIENYLKTIMFYQIEEVYNENFHTDPTRLIT